LPAAPHLKLKIFLEMSSFRTKRLIFAWSEGKLTNFFAKSVKTNGFPPCKSDPNYRLMTALSYLILFNFINTTLDKTKILTIFNDKTDDDKIK